MTNKTNYLRSRSSILITTIAAVIAPVVAAHATPVPTPDVNSTGLFGLVMFVVLFGIARFRTVKGS
jgi:hypothetical protein